MALKKHETLAVAGTVVSPAGTVAQVYDMGCSHVLCSTTQSVRFTIDGQTDPVITGTAEVGTLLDSSTLIVLTAEEWANSRWLDVSTDARVQFEFLQENRLRI